MSSASWPTLSSTKIVGDYDARLDYGVPSGLMGLLQIQGGKSGSRVIVLPGGHIRGLAQLWDALEPRAITMDGCTLWLYTALVITITMDGCSRALSPLNRWTLSLCEPSMSLVAGWWNRRHEGFGNFEGRDLYNWTELAEGMHSNSRSKSKNFHGIDEMTMIQEVHWNCYLVNLYADCSSANISWKNQKEAWYKSITTRGQLINGDNTRRCAACQLYRKTWRIINNCWHHMT